MIPDYANHAANERTFLAWVRTGVATIALGFVIEKFNIFLISVGRALPEGAISASRMQRLTSPVEHYGGLVLAISGFCLIVFALIRFLLTRKRLMTLESQSSGANVVTLFVLLTTILFVAGFSAFLALV